MVLDLATGDQLLEPYFHGAESRWRYSSHSLVRGFEGPGAKALALKLYCTARAALPARSLLTYDGQDNFDEREGWDPPHLDPLVNEYDRMVSAQDQMEWAAHITRVSLEFTGYNNVDRHYRLLDGTPEPVQACDRLFIPMIRHTVESLDGKRLSAALHRLSSVLDMHYDIAARERKKSTNAIATTYWYYKKILAQQLRDDLATTSS